MKKTISSSLVFSTIMPTISFAESNKENKYGQLLENVKGYMKNDAEMFMAWNYHKHDFDGFNKRFNKLKYKLNQNIFAKNKCKIEDKKEEEEDEFFYLNDMFFEYEKRDLENVKGKISSNTEKYIKMIDKIYQMVVRKCKALEEGKEALTQVFFDHLDAIYSTLPYNEKISETYLYLDLDRGSQSTNEKKDFWPYVQNISSSAKYKKRVFKNNKNTRSNT